MRKALNTVECPTLVGTIRWVFSIYTISSCNKIDWLTQTLCFEILRNQAKTIFVCKHHAVSLSFSLSTFTTCYQSLQTVWIQKIIRRFAGPDQGQTSIPRVNLVSACPAHNSTHISQRKGKFQTSTTNLVFACSAPFHAWVHLNCCF